MHRKKNSEYDESFSKKEIELIDRLIEESIKKKRLVSLNKVLSKRALTEKDSIALGKKVKKAGSKRMKKKVSFSEMMSGLRDKKDRF